MKFFETLWPYFQGEKIEALVFILPIALLCLVFGSWLLAEGESGLSRGVAIPFIAMGLVMAVVGGTVGFRTPTQTAQLQQSFIADPAQTIQSEVVRMEKVNAAWRWYLAIWITFAIVGLGLRLFTASDFWRGFGIALVFFSGLGLMIDGFADKRAQSYSHALHDMKKSELNNHEQRP